MGDTRMSKRPINPHVVMAMAVAVSPLMLNCALHAAAQAQPDSATAQDRAALLRVRPSLSGQKRGLH